MTTGTATYVRVCGKEYEIADHTQPKGKCSTCYDKNLDITLFALAILFATCATLAAYRYFPHMTTDARAMYAAGCFATGAAFVAVLAIHAAMRNRGCVVTRVKNVATS